MRIIESSGSLLEKKPTKTSRGNEKPMKPRMQFNAEVGVVMKNTPGGSRHGCEHHGTDRNQSWQALQSYPCALSLPQSKLAQT